MLPLTFVIHSFKKRFIDALYVPGLGYVNELNNRDTALPPFCVTHGAYILAGGEGVHTQHRHYTSQLYSILEGDERNGMGKGKRQQGRVDQKYKAEDLVRCSA